MISIPNFHEKYLKTFKVRSITICINHSLLPNDPSSHSRHLDQNHFKANKGQPAQHMKPQQDQSEG